MGNLDLFVIDIVENLGHMQLTWPRVCTHSGRRDMKIMMLPPSMR